MIIYQDSERTVSRIGDRLVIESVRGKREANLHGLAIHELSQAHKESIRAVRMNGNWMALYPGTMSAGAILFPAAMQPVIQAEINAFKDANEKREREAAAIAALPENIERARIAHLFESAESLRDYPGRYFPALLDARAALEHWREHYPTAAKQEDRRAFIDAAEALESKAKGALLYDADGWLSEAHQQATHDKFIEQARALRAKAEL